MKVVAINGSPRQKGNTSILLGVVLAELEAQGIATEVIQIGGQAIAGCKACYACAKHQDQTCAIKTDAFNAWYAKVLEADGLILASPTYYTDITSEMKAFIDRAGFVSRNNGILLAGKVGASLVAMGRAGGVHALDTMNHLFLGARMIIPGSSYWNIGIGRDMGEVEKDAMGLETMRVLGQDMARLMKALAAYQG